MTDPCPFFRTPTEHRWEPTRGVIICAYCDTKRAPSPVRRA